MAFRRSFRRGRRWPRERRRLTTHLSRLRHPCPACRPTPARRLSCCRVRPPGSRRSCHQRPGWHLGRPHRPCHCFRRCLELHPFRQTFHLWICLSNRRSQSRLLRRCWLFHRWPFPSTHRWRYRSFRRWNCRWFRRSCFQSFRRWSYQSPRRWSCLWFRRLQFRSSRRSGLRLFRLMWRWSSRPCSSCSRSSFHCSQEG